MTSDSKHSAKIAISPMELPDWPEVRAIYEEGIATQNATFETSAPDWASWNAKHLEAGRLVARRHGQVLGWVALGHVSSRCVYSGVAEVSIYVAASVRGQGVGTALLQAAVAGSEAAGIWTLQAGIFPENLGSIAVHKSCGFREVGVRMRLGQLAGLWRDVMLLERRSTIVGA
jgi:L-amino acid N-acyltransferase YncA